MSMSRAPRSSTLPVLFKRPKRLFSRSAMRATLTSRVSPVKLYDKWSTTGNMPKRLRPKLIAIRPGSKSWRASLRAYDRSRPPHNEVGTYRQAMP